MTFIRTAAGIVQASAPAWLYQLLYRENLGRNMRIGPEDRAAIETADKLRVWALEGRLLATFTHVPHEVGGGGGKASELRYALAKAMGLVAGSGDYVFVGPEGGGWIELKAAARASVVTGRKIAAGRLNPAQKLFRDWCARVGARYAVCHSADEVQATLTEWGMLCP